jgi:acetolactate synthase-1/2/3 large subunit
MTRKTGSAGNAIVAEALAAALARHGIDAVFGQSIPSQLHLAAPQYGIRQIAYRTENAGAVMADGYARIAGRIGVVTAQNGPAATLLVAGLAEALKASVPVLALVQDVALANFDKNAFQDLDHLDLFRGVAKWLRRVHTADRIDDYVDMAITAATCGRPGPAVLLLPHDLLGAAAMPGAPRDARLGTYPLDRPAADAAAVREAARLLSRARAPLVVAGGGVHLSGAAQVLAALQERAGLPVATTTMGKGAVDETHPLSIGVIGYFMGPNGLTRYQRPLVEEADVVLLIGTRTNQNGTDSWKLLPRSARFIHLDLDGEEIGRTYEALRLQGDAKATLEGLLEALETEDLGKRTKGRKSLEARIAGGKTRHREEARAVLASTERPVRPERLMADLDRILTPDDIVVADASYSSIWIANYLTARRPGQRFITPRGIAGIGWGLPLALGAKLARPHARVFAFAGDGGFAHVWPELETARRMEIAVVMTVLNNQILGYQKHAEDALYGDHTLAVDFTPVDHAAIARACGLKGIRIEDPKDYAQALAEAAVSEATTLIDVVTDPDAYPPITVFEGRLPAT